MRPALSPAHGTSLGTTAGITAVITLVLAASVMAQCRHAAGAPACVAGWAIALLILGAAALYAARNQIGRALDHAASDVRASGVAAAYGLALFHLGMACVMAGTGLAAVFRMSVEALPRPWLVGGIAIAIAAISLVRAVAWVSEARGRGAR
jgi:hypothetical protein